MPICSKCGEYKSKNDFFKQSKSKTGYKKCCKICHLEYSRKYHLYNKEDPLKIKCRLEVERLIKKGELVRPERCPICHSKKYHICAHHTNYNFPKDIIWCCRKCHNLIHKKGIQFNLYPGENK